MDIVVTQEQARIPVTVFHVTGDLNVNTYEALQKRAREAYEAGTRDLILELSGVNYISSAGIRAISAIFRLLRGSAAEESPEAMQRGLKDGTFKSPHLKLSCVPGNVHDVLHLAGVNMFLEIHPNVQVALASY